MLLGIVGIFVALLLFLFLVYRGLSSYIAAPICVLVVALTNLLSPLEAFTETYVGGMIDLITTMFPVIFFGAIMGKLYLDTGAAAALSNTLLDKFAMNRQGDSQVKAAVLVLLIFSSLCSIGGIDGYVLMFTMFPICVSVCVRLDIPRRLIPCLLVLQPGIMAAPGAPQIHNIMAVTVLDVPSTAGLIPGIIAALIIETGCYFTATRIILQARRRGEHWDWGAVQQMPGGGDGRALPNFWVALLPLVLVFVLYSIVHLHVAVALVCGVLLTLVTMSRYIVKNKAPVAVAAGAGGGDIPAGSKAGGFLRSVMGSLNSGADNYPNALMAIITPSGLAAVVTSTAAFGMIIGLMQGMPFHPLIVALIFVCVVVALTSSPPAAIAVAGPILAGMFVWVAEPAISAPALARVCALAASTFESLPFNGMMVMGVALAKTTQRQSYFPVFMQTVVFTLIGTVVAALLLIAFPGLA